MLKISVIIPVYNTEKYLTQCLESVINQTYKNLEIICVEDCSTDNSKEILQKYAQKDDRIKIVYNEINSKLGISRNNGFSVATGDYIHFLDSDDWLEDDIYLNLTNELLLIGDVDAISFSWFDVSLSGEKEVAYNCDIANQPTNIVKEPFIIDYWFDQVWARLYNRNFLSKNNLLFNNYPCVEDVEFSLKVITLANNVYILPLALLNYRNNIPNHLASKKHYYWESVYKSFFNSFFYFDENQIISRNRKFSVYFDWFYYFLWDCYEKNTITLTKIKEIVTELNEFILNKDFVNYKWYLYYKEILEQPIHYVRIKFVLRKFFKTYLPAVHKFIVGVRKLFIK